MPISHKSILHTPIGYTLPVDLNLLGKILQYKQGEFDAGVAKVQGSIDSIAALDVVKDSDKQYVTSKLSNLVNTVNNIGGADYSDPNISNQIAGLSSQIYGDKNVINAVSGTKLFRYTQQYYKDLKEKKPKDWSPANEWYDMNKFAGWLNDGQVGTSPQNGAGSVTPYNKYQDDWQKMFNTITQSANVTTEITDKGLMYRLDSHKLVSPERIWEIASTMLDPGQRQQLGIEGRFTYNNLPLDQLTKAYDSQTYKKVTDANAQLLDYQAKLKGATSLEDQEKYEQLVNEKEVEINTLLDPIRKNAEQIKESLYLNEKLKGLQARYAFQQSTTKLQPASDKMFKLNYQLQAKKFEYQQQKDADDREVDLAIAGMRMVTDMFGHRTYLRDPSLGRAGKNGGPDYSGIPGIDNALEGQTNQFSFDKINDKKQILVEANNKLFQDFIRDLGKKKGLSGVIISDILDDGNIQTIIDPEMRKAAQKMMDAWNAMTRGEKINYSELDPLFKSFAGQYQQNTKEIEAYDKYLSNIDNQVRQEYGISNKSMAAYSDYQRALAEIDQARRSGDPSYMDQAQKKLAQVTYQYGLLSENPAFNGARINKYLGERTARRDALIASADNVFNLPTLPMTDDKNKNLAKLIAGNAGTLQYYDESGEPVGKETLNFDNIEPQSKGYAYINADGTASRQPVLTFKLKTGSDAEDYKILKVPLTPIQQQALGFGRDIRDLSGYNLGLVVNGEVTNINTTSGRSYDLKYDLVKYNDNDRNDPAVFLRVKKGNATISLYNRPFPSYEQAVQFMESAARLKTEEEAFKYLNELSK